MFNPLQLREIFHLLFLRWLGQKIKVENYALKGGANLRFFYQSFRYSEDIDLDIFGIKVVILKDVVMKILQSSVFRETLKPFGIENIIPPNISKAKQTETTQRFKVHLLTASGEDLFTKVEFSRRGLKGKIIVQPVSDIILRSYKMPPLLVAHYDLNSAIIQKIEALITRSIIQARDVFDVFILSSQYRLEDGKIKTMDKDKLIKAQDNVWEISFTQFRDTVLSYLAAEDQAAYNRAESWDEVKLKVVNFIEELKRDE